MKLLKNRLNCIAKCFVIDLIIMKRITIRDVAREAKVSVTLVSFVMNAKRDKDGNLDCPVNAETAKRVLQVAQRLGYRRNFAAANSLPVSPDVSRTRRRVSAILYFLQVQTKAQNGLRA